MKRFLSLGIFFMALLLLTSCGPKVEAPNAENPVSSPSDQVETPSSSGQGSNPAPIKAVVSLDYASEELLSQKGTFNEFVDVSSEYELKAAFTANTAVRDFKYVELSFSEAAAQNGEISLHVEKVLYSTNELSPEKPLVVTTQLDGAIPNRGISYLDENGTERYFTVSMSGQDSSLLLTEFTPA